MFALPSPRDLAGGKNEGMAETNPYEASGTETRNLNTDSRATTIRVTPRTCIHAPRIHFG